MKHFAILAAFVLTPTTATAAITIDIDPSLSFLRANGEVPGLPSAILLSDIGINSGDVIAVETFGMFQFGTSPDSLSSLAIGVFSSDNVVLSDVTLLERVPGAIAAGTPIATPPTAIGGLPTDIAEDFKISPIIDSFVVPEGASYLFLTALDSGYVGNTVPAGGEFGVSITIIPAPGTAVALISAFGLVRVRPRRRQPLSPPLRDYLKSAD